MDNRDMETNRDMNRRNTADRNLKGSSGRHNRDDEFATHYYGNERDLRERDRIAREESRARREREMPRSSLADSQQSLREDFEDRAARDSDIGREPYRPERHYHRASVERERFSGRKNWKQMYEDLSQDFAGLFRKESALIRTELSEKADLVKQGAVSITTGAIVTFVGMQAIVATVIIALGNIMPWWAASLITGVVLLVIGMGLMAAAKRKLSSDNLTPYRSMESFEHMGEMLKEKKDEYTRH